ncbi:MAG: hypothetical protein JXN61_09775 [Sedimentisphaerales bacterium]|nr:hypothetical protein [Sedimentisphaerales bacterium]
MDEEGYQPYFYAQKWPTFSDTIHMKGGRIIPQGTLSGNYDIKWEPGLYDNIADFNLDGNVNFADYACFPDTWLWQART